MPAAAGGVARSLLLRPLSWLLIGGACGLVAAETFVALTRDADDYEFSDAVVGMAFYGSVIGAALGLLIGAARAVRRSRRGS